MCQAIRYNQHEFPEEMLKQHQLRCIDNEVRVYYAHKKALLPVLLNGENQLIKWGNKENFKIPKTGFCKKESLEAGKWRWLHPIPVTIPASAGLMNGIWFQIREGIQGIIIKNEQGGEHCYIVTQPATHYFKTMTGAERMPVLINQIV